MIVLMAGDIGLLEVTETKLEGTDIVFMWT